MYDTYEVDEIADWDNGKFNSDLDMVIEKLYRTKKGNFFLYGRGGSRTFYRGGGSIEPYDEENVKSWLEAKNREEAYIELFNPEEA